MAGPCRSFVIIKELFLAMVCFFFKLKKKFLIFIDWDARSARVLLFLVVPGHIIFNWLISFLHTGENPPTSALFTSIYLGAAIAQVSL